MKRKITDELLLWKNRASGRGPLLVCGARQVGKTWVVREFGLHHYGNVAYFNFATNLALRSYFAESINPERILRFLEAESKERILPGDTLIFFDDVQSCERVLTSLRNFREKAPQYHIICVGSPLIAAVYRKQPFYPVGKADLLTLFPMDFEEFLWALAEERLSVEIKNAFAKNKALPKVLHQKALDLFKQYLIVGGMPQAASEYVKSKSFLTVPELQNKIISDYIADITRSTTNTESARIRAVFDSIPLQLAKENKKFQYKLAQKGGTATMLGAAIEWLLKAGVVLKSERLTYAFMPNLASFKLYMGDTGLLTMKSGVSPQNILSAGMLDNNFVGSIAENYVAQALAGKGYELYYWTSEGTAALDFILQGENDIIAVEVKAWSRAKSRSLYMFKTKYKPAYSIRISANNFGFENNTKSVPLYAVFCI